jgi:hypothetical protein
MAYFVTMTGACGTDVAAGPFETRAGALAVCTRYRRLAPAGAAGTRRAIHGPSAAGGGCPAAGLSYAVVSGAELREACLRGLVYRW